MHLVVEVRPMAVEVAGEEEEERRSLREEENCEF